MLIVADVAHSPAAGVNVYVVVPAAAVLMVAGLHVPFTPLFDSVGSAVAVVFWQKGPSWVNVGVIGAVTTISIVVTIACWPEAGVNV
jgi:hypothetical protein